MTGQGWGAFLFKPPQDQNTSTVSKTECKSRIQRGNPRGHHGHCFSEGTREAEVTLHSLITQAVFLQLPPVLVDAQNSALLPGRSVFDLLTWKSPTAVLVLVLDILEASQI